MIRVNDLKCYLDWINHIKTHQGLPYAVKLNKQIRLHVTRFISGHPLTISDLRISLTRDGLPTALGRLVPIIRKGEPADLRLILTLLSAGRIVLGDGTLDLTSIVSPFTGDLGKIGSLQSAISAVTRDLIKSEVTTEWSEPHLTTKAGPNGQAIGTALKDLAILPDSLKEDLCTLGGLNLRKYIDLLLPAAKGLNPDFKGSLRRISIIRDKECKNRPIAIFDYFSQSCLVPLHKSLFEILRRIPTDLTFDQSAIEKVLAHPASSYYSLDLSNATDRFPVSLQEAVLAQLIGPEKAGAWRRIMTQPLKTPNGRTISYEVGQPMGAYSSWAMFTLCHHLIVQYSAIQVGEPAWFMGYRLLGDDIVIFDSRVADQYRENLKILGVNISESKSHVSKDTFELAKRWFHRGTEISPYPLIGLIESISNPHGLAIEIYSAMRKGWSTALCQGYPDGKDIAALLQMLGWSKRSRSQRGPFIEGFLALYHALDNEGTLGGDRSVRLLASLLGQSSQVARPSSWLEEFMKIVYEVKLKELAAGIQAAHDRLASGHQNAVIEMVTLGRVCRPPANPYEIALALPYLRVIGLATKELQATMVRLQDNPACGYKDTIALGNEVVFPDPDRIKSTRTSHVIVNRTGATLLKIFRSYVEVTRSDLDTPSG